jgi:hypothetical protein
MMGRCTASAHSLSVAEVVLLALEEGLHELPRHQLHVVAKREELTAQMMGADTGLHADQARRHVGKANRDLAARQLLPQHDRSALVEADQVERVLTDIDANRGYGAVACFAVHGVCSSGLVAPAICGQEHGRSIPLTDIIKLGPGRPQSRK